MDSQALAGRRGDRSGEMADALVKRGGIGQVDRVPTPASRGSLPRTIDTPPAEPKSLAELSVLWR